MAGNSEPVASQDVAAEKPFDRVTALARALANTPIAAVTISEGDQYALSSALGMSPTNGSVSDTLSQHALAPGQNGMLVIEDAASDPRTRDNPHVTGAPHIRFYAAAVITAPDGRHRGAVAVADIVPRGRPTEDMLNSLRMLARIAGDICEQIEAGRQQEERLQTLKLAEAMAGVGHFRVDARTGKVSWSDEVFRIHGLEPGSIDPNLHDTTGAYHPEDAEVIGKLLTRAFETGEGYDAQLRLTRTDGVERVTRSKAHCERDEAGTVSAVFGVFQDVTESVLSAQHLAESEKRHRMLTNRATDIIITYGVDTRVTYVSPAIERVSGHRPEDVIGRSVLALVHPDDVPGVVESFREFIQASPEGQDRGVTYRGLVKDGSLRWFEARTSIIRDKDDQVVGFQDLVRDVTETRELQEALIVARDRAEAGARAKSEFLANMSHELRTPLTSVIGFSGLLQQSVALPETERRYADRIGTASEALLGVINDILDYSKLEAGAVEMEARAFDPRALAQAAAAMIEGQCEVKGLQLAVDLDPDLPTALAGDEGRLRQVMLNFLSNAAKFTATGRVTLDVRWLGDRLRVAVSDTGIGIPAEKIDALFERFSQADNSTTRVYGGTGLGLSISRRLVEMMDGEIGAESRMGEGSTFWFEVPLTPDEAIAEKDGAGGEALIPEGMRILMADDAPANRELVTAILGSMGVALETVEDGAQAVAAARDGGYDLILMDVHMPVMDGLDATRAIRAMGGVVGRTPIVALTANVQPEQVLRCQEAGMDGHVGKPIQISELLTALAMASAGSRDDTAAEPLRSVER